MKIKHRFEDRILYTDDSESMLETVLNAVKAKANLSGANLSGANLSEANLSGAYLSGANLSEANLSRAYLSGAYLSGANLSGAYLSGANLSRANLSEADLSEAYLSGANLSGANLSRANLSEANLSGAYLSGANLSGAYLSGANLSRANLSEADLPHYQICPEVGSFVAWKKTRDGVIQVLIPADAARVSSLVGRKCRASHIVTLNTFGRKVCRSIHDGRIVYREGETVRCSEAFNDDIRVECTSGIHFFMTRKEAEEFSL